MFDIVEPQSTDDVSGKRRKKVYDVARCQGHTAQLARTTGPRKARCADLRSKMKLHTGHWGIPQGGGFASNFGSGFGTVVTKRP
jgi:hypothetical protein